METLLQILVCFLLLVEKSFSKAVKGPIPVSADNDITISWTRNGVSQYTDSNPLNVSWGSFLKFQCAAGDRDSLVYVVRADVYNNNNISDACSMSKEISLDEWCIPQPVADCQQDRLEKKIHGENDTSLSCTTASFLPGNIYYLANFPRSNEPRRCMFSMPLRVCDKEEGCSASESATPSPSTTVDLLASPSPSVSHTTNSRIISGGKSQLTLTVEPTSNPSPPTLIANRSAVLGASLLTLFTSLVSMFVLSSC